MENIETLSDRFATIADLVPRRDELLDIARFWYMEFLTDRWFEYWTELYGSGRLMRLAAYRIGQIRRVLGDEAVIAAGQEVVDELGEGIDDRHTWNSFLVAYGISGGGSGLRLGPTDED
jgi:hypothetical protein